MPGGSMVMTPRIGADFVPVAVRARRPHPPAPAPPLSSVDRGFRGSLMDRQRRACRCRPGSRGCGPAGRTRRGLRLRPHEWHDHSRGQVTFAEYVETVWLPSKQVETSTLAAYRSYLDKHFIPVFGRRPMGKILPSEVQRWVTTATANGLSAASVGKYHTMLSSVFERALVDRVVTFNPCAHTELPKRIKKKRRTLTPDEYDAILDALPAQHRLMVETAINTGLRWGELIALKPRHLDLDTGSSPSRRPSSRSPSRTPPPASGCSPSPTPRTTNPAPWASRPTSSPSWPTRIADTGPQGR